MTRKPAWENKPFWIRFFHWEYWNFHVIYLPIYPVWLYYSIRAGSFFFFAASNPSIRYGGFLSESKKDIHDLIPALWRARSLFFSVPAEPGNVLREILEAGMNFPLIGKPDFGGKGRGVKKLENIGDLLSYAGGSLIDFHIQEYIQYPRETGIFYCRMPGSKKGQITGVVEKKFLTVVGDGEKSILRLLKENPRAVLQLKKLEPGLSAQWATVPAAGEEVVISPYGNHARGALFLDETKTVSPALEIAIDGICREIPDFYFGRLDIKYQSRELLEEKKSFCIVEVNGAGSEPTHIYDPRHSLFFAWKEIIRHLDYLYRISRENHRRGHPYLSMGEGLNMFKKDRADSALLSKMEKRI